MHSPVLTCRDFLSDRLTVIISYAEEEDRAEKARDRMHEQGLHAEKREEVHGLRRLPGVQGEMIIRDEQPPARICPS